MLLDGWTRQRVQAFEVRIERAAQFNREYSRLFRPDTDEDIRTLHSPGAPAYWSR